MTHETQLATIQQRNHFKPGQEIEFFGPEIDSFKQVKRDLRKKVIL